MKKVKIMLTAVTVLAIVGGALAFKARKSTFTIYTTTTPGLNATCPNATPFVTTTNVNPGYAKISLTTVAPINGVAQPCIETWTKAE